MGLLGFKNTFGDYHTIMALVSFKTYDKPITIKLPLEVILL